MPRLTIVIPTRDDPSNGWKNSNVTMRSLRRQIFKDFTTVCMWDRDKKGAGWARNRGFDLVATELVLFSDDDIDWRPRALESMVHALDANPKASYAYGAYRSNWRDPKRIRTIGQQQFDAGLLRQRNYISTMSVIRSADFPGFDESLRRYQDWDLWLTMLGQGKVGAYCGDVVFETRLDRGGITFGSIPIAEAREIIARKHGLCGA
jgi:glycosyltransferase involved in cell wall biosynthesis